MCPKDILPNKLNTPTVTRVNMAEESSAPLIQQESISSPVSTTPGRTTLQYSSSDEPITEVIRVGESKDRVKISPVLLLCIIATVLGSSTQFGYNIGVINNPENAIRASFNQSTPYTDTLWALTVSSFLIGGMIGSLIAGVLADLIGRKWSLLGNNIVILGGVALESLSINPYMLVAGRFVVGVNAGFNTVLAPMYLSEISPIKYRGAIGTTHQLAITIAVLFSQILGIHEVLGRPDSEFHAWRILLAVPLIFMAVQVLILPFCPESPKYLYIRRNNEAAAKKALSKLCGSEDIYNELQAIKDESRMKSAYSSFLELIKDFFKNPALRRPLLISVILHASQQITGIGAILFYSTRIFRDAGIDQGDVATAIVGVMLVIGTIVTIILIDYVGRRSLMLYGLGGMTICFLLVTSMFCFQDAFYSSNQTTSVTTAPGVLLVVFSFGVTLSFAIGPGAIPWLMVSELFQQGTRPFAVSVATVVNWLSNFAVGEAFPYMLTYLSPYATVIFAALCGLLWFFQFLYLPETKGRTVDEMAEHFQMVTSKRNCCSGLECVHRK